MSVYYYSIYYYILLPAYSKRALQDLSLVVELIQRAQIADDEITVGAPIDKGTFSTIQK